ncbi:nucleotidyltransferase domain-containing protein [Lacticaseibacillus nasuensis]|uniref:nucleotidyltransferase domain-containing protein n=1 Tax=Lacticaseibacillus nasuensis TaxID=944671 RepID=UPI00224797C0|nr:nucleotidyltransferase [Lacticaseibacillus nasuensis]MCX2456015.1 nucleotidyltransferase [Lacticaseibacillus nasuensis]
MNDATYLLQKICQQIVLSDTAKKTVVREYSALGNLISNSTRIAYDVDIKPQGSYNLGTAIQPIHGSADDFDIDLVAIVHGDELARETKQSIGDVLKSSSLYSQKLLPEKRRAWTIEYTNSHVDIVPAIDNPSADVSITNKLKNGQYEYRQSSPFAFKTWFCEKSQNVFQSNPETVSNVRADVEAPEDYSDYTILQKVVQLLKFHRNVMFESRDKAIKPISMIITILAAESYSGQDDLSQALTEVTNELRKQIVYDSYGNSHILNPVNPLEDFADKWIDHPEREKAFFEWLDAVELQLGDVNRREIISLNQTLSGIYGKDRVRFAFKALGEKQSKMQRQGNISIVASGVLGGESSGKKVRPHTFWGD